VRDGEKGPLIIDVVKCRVQARTETGGTGPDEVLFISREKQADGTFKHDYYCPCDGTKTLAFRRILQVLRCSAMKASHGTLPHRAAYIRQQEGTEPDDGGDNFQVTKS